MRPALLTTMLALSSLACGLGVFRGEPTAPIPPSPETVAPTDTVDPTEEPTPPEPSPQPTQWSDVSALPEPSSARWEPVVQGLTQPVDLQATRDERLFVVEQPGVIRVVSGGELLQPPFLDLRDRALDDAFERGLLGLAFDPNFAQNGTFYVNYTGRGGHTRVSRFAVSADPNRADPDSEQVLLRIEQPYRNHNGGGLAFGPDGYLYIGVGDGGSGGDPQGNGQNVGTLLGSLLRVDVHSGDPYGIPEDNPFVVREGARNEIWDFGLRNPWRFAFDPANGDLYIADVGQNEWEEINFEPAGSPGGINYGWNLFEGSHSYAGGGEGTTLPIAEYSHSFGCSVTGGVVVRDPDLPRWQGVYLYGDFCSGNVWGLVRDQGGTWVSERLFQTAFRISAFGTDARGNVYLLDHNGGVHQLHPAN